LLSTIPFITILRRKKWTRACHGRKPHIFNGYGDMTR
jgi:hypothetical protein